MNGGKASTALRLTQHTAELAVLLLVVTPSALHHNGSDTYLGLGWLASDTFEHNYSGVLLATACLF